MRDFVGWLEHELTAAPAPQQVRGIRLAGASMRVSLAIAAVVVCALVPTMLVLSHIGGVRHGGGGSGGAVGVDPQLASNVSLLREPLTAATRSPRSPFPRGLTPRLQYGLVPDAARAVHLSSGAVVGVIPGRTGVCVQLQNSTGAGSVGCSPVLAFLENFGAGQTRPGSRGGTMTGIFIDSVRTAAVMSPGGDRRPLQLVSGAYDAQYIRGDCLLLTLANGTHAAREIDGPLTGACARYAGVVVPTLGRRPYVGVSCPGAPNSIKCDRVSITVWTRQRLSFVTIAIGGRRLQLQPLSSYQSGEGWQYTGYLQPAGLLNGPLRVRPDKGRYLWYGKHPVYFTMQVIAPTGSDGTDVGIPVRLMLNTGAG